MSHARVQDLFEQIDRTPFGPEERALVAEAVALAVDSGDTRLEYEARMRQTSSANMLGDTELMLTSFAWCLAQHDGDPERFPSDLGNGGADLLWQFKWMAGCLSGSPAFDSAQIAAVLDDMEEHYRKAGLGPSGVLMARFEDAWSAGRIEEAEALRVQLEATPRDSHSHCDACVRSQIAGFLIDTDRDAEAIRLVEELIEGGFSCGEEPEHALSRVLLPYLRAGETDKARHAHLRSYRLAKDNADNLTIVANNLVFCALTGNEARALSLVERHLPWLAHDGLNSEAHLSALAAFSLALRAVTDAGHGDTVVRGADAERLRPFFGTHEGPWRAAELAEVAQQGAERIAADFDRRNGTDSHRVQLERTLALGSERYEVPLSPEPLLPRAVAEEPRSDAERVQRAIDLGDYGVPEGIAAAHDALPVATPAQRPSLLSITVHGLFAQEREEEARTALGERIASLRAVGRDEQADLEERVGLALFGRRDPHDVAALRAELSGPALSLPETRAAVGLTLAAAVADEDDEEALRLALAAADEAARAEEPRLVLSAQSLLASLHGRRGEVEQSETVIDRVLSSPASGAGQRARLHGLRARLRGAQQRFAEGALDADETCRVLVSLDARSALPEAYALAAALHEDAGAAGDAVARFRFAAQAALDEGAVAGPLQYRTARALLAAGAPDEAADILVEVFSEETEREEPAPSRAQTMMLLARAFEESGEPGRAAGAWEYAAELFEEGGVESGRASALVFHGKLLTRFGEHDDALASLETAAEIARRSPEDPGLLTDALHTLGQVRAAQGDESALALFDEVVSLAEQHEAVWLVADVTDSRARALGVFERTDEAVAMALQAADAFAAIGDDGSAGGSELYAARLLTGAGRPQDAVPVYRSIMERSAEFPPLRQVAALELGDALETLGRVAEAAEVRSVIES